MDYYEHIEDYLEDRLSPNVREEFSAAMKKDEDLEKAVKHYYDAKKLSEVLLELDMMETIEKVRDSKSHGEQAPTKTLGGKWLALVGLIALLLLGWWYASTASNQKKYDQLLASYVRPVDTYATKSIDTVGMSPFEKGKHFFALNRFQDSETWLKIYLEKENDKNMRSIGHFWLGAAHIEQKELSEARAAFRKSKEAGAQKNLELLKQ